MAEVFSSDDALIDKLENIAGVTNEDVLSDTEILRGRVLLAKARDGLYTHSSSQSQLSLPDHIERLSIALAPHKRLPPEIMEQIFCSHLHSRVTVGIPPQSSEYPWVLGRVCGSWRRISRSIPDLWYTPIYFDETVAYPDQIYVASVRDLRYATEILPEVAYLFLNVPQSRHIPTRALTPYLYRLDELDWTVPLSAEQEALEAFPPGSLSRLKNLSVTTDHPDTVTKHPITYPDLFGTSPLLRRLSITMSSDTRFLLSNVPWPQLQSFHLRSSFSSSSNMHPPWLLLGHHIPFQQLKCLEELTLDLRTDFLGIVLNYSFPWHQLKILSIHQSIWYQDILLVQIIDRLQKCTSLKRFDFSNLPVSSDFFYEPQVPIMLPSLEELQLGYVPLCMIKPLVSSGALRSLRLWEISLQEFYAIVKHCPKLEQLSSDLSMSALTSPDADDTIVLPHLTSLYISTNNASLSLPTLLVTPLLASFRLYIKGGSFALDMITAFIIQSNMKLECFECIFSKYTIQYTSAKPLRELLSLLNSCSDVIISPSIFPEEILDEIGSGSLLPIIRILGFGASSSESILATIRRRLEQEVASNYVRLRNVTFGLPADTFDAEEELLEVKLAELQTQYGVHFGIFPMDIDTYIYA